MVILKTQESPTIFYQRFSNQTLYSPAGQQSLSLPDGPCSDKVTSTFILSSRTWTITPARYLLLERYRANIFVAKLTMKWFYNQLDTRLHDCWDCPIT